MRPFSVALFIHALSCERESRVNRLLVYVTYGAVRKSYQGIHCL